MFWRAVRRHWTPLFESTGRVAHLRDQFGNLTKVTWDVPPPGVVEQTPAEGRFVQTESEIVFGRRALIIVFGPPLILVILRVLAGH